MDNNKPKQPETQATRRDFAKKAYVVPAVLAAIKASESVANAQPFPVSPPTIASEDL